MHKNHGIARKDELIAATETVREDIVCTIELKFMAYPKEGNTCRIIYAMDRRRSKTYQ